MNDRVSYSCKTSHKTSVRVFRCDIPLRFADKCAIIFTLLVDTTILAPADREVVLIVCVYVCVCICVCVCVCVYIYLLLVSGFCIGIGKIKQVLYV